MKIKFITMAILSAMFIMSCGETSEDVTTAASDKQGAIEIQLASKHLDTLHDEITIYKQYYVRSICIKKDTIRDTVIALGKTQEWGEDSLGNEKQFTVKKDYEFFITIK